jgi:hypothetical protein
MNGDRIPIFQTSQEGSELIEEFQISVSGDLNLLDQGNQAIREVDQKGTPWRPGSYIAKLSKKGYWRVLRYSHIPTYSLSEPTRRCRIDLR